MTRLAALASFEKALAGKKILVTGHTGFTGGWACRWLSEIGAIVAGFSLPPNTEPSLFKILGLAKAVPTAFGDISEYDALYNAVREFGPHLILHLAAQPLVRESYRDPVRTFHVNVQGTVHLLEVARHVKSVKAVLSVTTDKVYYNNESDDRLIPDFVRAMKNNASMMLRFPDATRPWQHVLALVQGHLMILAGLISDDSTRFARARNLGPLDNRPYSVRAFLEMMCKHWGSRPQLRYFENPLPESRALALDSSNARDLLGWRPVWDTERVIQETAKWYRDFYDDPSSAPGITLDQINSWRAALK